MTRRARSLAVLPVVAALLVPLSACSGGGEDEDAVQEFCDQGEQTFAEVDATGSLGSDPEAFAEAVTNLHEGFVAMDPPAEIAAEWEQIGDLFGQLDDSLQSIDLTDQAAFQAALTEFSETAGSEDATAASDAIGTFLTDSCEA
jgi:hypothetical protein